MTIISSRFALDIGCGTSTGSLIAIIIRLRFGQPILEPPKLGPFSLKNPEDVKRLLAWFDLRDCPNMEKPFPTCSPVLGDEGQSIMNPRAEEYSNVTHDHQNAGKVPLPIGHVTLLSDTLLRDYDFPEKIGYANNRGNHKPRVRTNDGILTTFNRGVHLFRPLTHQDEESESGTDHSIFHSTGSVTSEDSLTSVETSGACSQEWICDHCDCDHCIDEAILSLKMDRADCLQSIELWEKALHIIG